MQKETGQFFPFKKGWNHSDSAERVPDGDNKPLISVILATKGNKEELLEKCLDSLLKQNFQEFEIILVYSVFPEGLRGLIESKGIISLKENSTTLGAARNLGAKQAAAELIAFIDDDAQATENWLSNIYSIFQQYPSVSCLGGPNLTPSLEREKNALRSAQGSFLESRVGQTLRLNKYAVGKIAGCNVAYRKAIFEKNGYLNERLRSGEDWEFHIRLLENGYQLRFDPQILVWHHRQGLKHAFLNMSKMVPFFLSWKTLKYSRYESLFASFYVTNSLFLILLVTIFFSPIIFILLLSLALLFHFAYTAVSTKTFGREIIYYPFQILVTLSQIIGFYYGLLRQIASVFHHH